MTECSECGLVFKLSLLRKGEDGPVCTECSERQDMFGTEKESHSHSLTKDGDDPISVSKQQLEVKNRSPSPRSVSTIAAFFEAEKQQQDREYISSIENDLENLQLSLRKVQ